MRAAEHALLLYVYPFESGTDLQPNTGELYTEQLQPQQVVVARGSDSFTSSTELRYEKLQGRDPTFTPIRHPASPAAVR